MIGAFKLTIQTDHGLVELGDITSFSNIAEPVEENQNDEISHINSAEFSMEVVLKPQYLRNFLWIAKGENPWTNAKRKRVYFARRKRKVTNEKRISYRNGRRVHHMPNAIIRN